MLEQRVGNVSKDSARIQRNADQVRLAMGEPGRLEHKFIDMVNQPDADTNSRVRGLEVSCNDIDSYAARLEFSTYLDELRKDRKEVVEALVLEGLNEARGLRTPRTSVERSRWGSHLRDNTPIERETFSKHSA